MKKYNLSDIMKNAWTFFRGGKKSFGECLHEAWTVAKMTLIGNLWEKYGKRRVYFDRDMVMDLCGVKVDYYKSGNVRHAELDGVQLSNTDGHRWLSSCDGIFYDLVTGKFGVKYGSSYTDSAIEKIRNFLHI